MSNQNNTARANRTAQPAARRANQPLTAESRSARELLRGVEKAINSRDPARALRILERISSRTTDESLRRRICLRAAELANKQGRYHDASQWFLQATRRSYDDSELLTQAIVGQVRALLRLGRADHAMRYAAPALVRTIDIEQDYRRRRATAEAQLARGQRATIPPRPVRASVAASRLAAQFLAEGELVHARDLYQRAIASNPHGATRAREGLAKIALATGELPEAEARVREALLVGKYQRKTCSLWPLWVQSRLRQNKDPLPAELLPAILKITNLGVRSTHLWQLITALRSAGHDAWKTFATQVTPHLQEHHIREVTRLLSLEHRKAGNAAALHVGTSALLTTPLEPTRWLATAKDNFSSALRLGQQPDPQALIAAASRLDENFTRRTRHALAKVAYAQHHYDTAVTLFEQAIAATPPASSHHHRALWSLARTRYRQGRIADCADCYFRYADNPHPPQELRLKARLNAIRVLGESGDTDAIASHLPRIETEARNLLPDWFATLNICRYLMFAGKDARAAAERLYNQANALALQELAATNNNTRQVEILEQLNRRRVYDLGKNHDAIEQYHALKHHIHNTLWSTSNTYFDYLRWIGLALTRELPDQAAAHYQSILEDAATPSGPRAMLSLDLAEHLIHHHKQPARALALINNTLAEHPTGPHTPRAHYWLMLSAYSKNDEILAKKYALKILSDENDDTINQQLFYKATAESVLAYDASEISDKSIIMRARTLLNHNLKLISVL